MAPWSVGKPGFSSSLVIRLFFTVTRTPQPPWQPRQLLFITFSIILAFYADSSAILFSISLSDTITLPRDTFIPPLSSSVLRHRLTISREAPTRPAKSFCVRAKPVVSSSPPYRPINSLASLCSTWDRRQVFHQVRVAAYALRQGVNDVHHHLRLFP